MDPGTRSIGSNGTAGRAAVAAPQGPTTPPGWAEVDGYHFHRLLRRTPAADVYLAYHPATRAYREVIVVRRFAGVDQGALRRAAEAEVAAAGALSHPGIAPAEDVGLTRDGRLYVACARPVGRPLSEILADEGPVPVRRALHLGLAVVDAAAAAHDAGVVHGRLTPDNVIVVPQQAGRPERAVVLGFGTAAAQDGAPGPALVPGEHGAFASPERAAGGPASVCDDVFGLGSILMSMFTGGPVPVVRAAAPGAGPAAGDAQPGVIIQVLRRARAAVPGQRYASAAALGAVLRSIDDALSGRTAVSAGGASLAVASLEVPAGILPLEVRESPGRRRVGRRSALLAAGVVGVVAAGGTAFAWRSGRVPAFSAPPAVAIRGSEPARAAPRPPVPAPAGVPVVVPPAAAPPIVVPPVAAAPPAGQAPAGAGIPPRQSELADPPAGAAPAAAREVAASGAPPSGRVAGRTVPPAVRVAASADRRAGSGVAANASAATTTSAAAGDVAAARPPATGAGTPGADMPGVGPAGAGTDGSAAASADAASADAVNANAAGVNAASSAAGVRAAVAEYANAIEARDLAWLRRVYPGMTEAQRRAWATFFGSVDGLRARLVVDWIFTTSTTAQVGVRGTYEYQNLRPRRAERSPVTFTATLARDGGGWRVRAVE